MKDFLQELENSSHPIELLEKTVFVLGPDLMQISGLSLSKYFYHQLLQEAKLTKRIENKIEAQIDSEVYSIQEKICLILELIKFERSTLSRNAQEVFNTQETNSNLIKLSKIPARVYLSTTPDKLLINSFESNGIDYWFDWHGSKNPPRLSKKTRLSKTPLVYGLFGSIKEEDSLILGYDKLFDYLLESSFRMSVDIKDEIQKARYYLFLGFNFTDWYLKIILRILNCQNKQSSFSYGEDKGKSIDTLFFQNYYKVFFADKNLDLFINRLFEICKSKSILRQEDKSKKFSLKQKLIDLLIADFSSDSIQEVKSTLQNLESFSKFRSNLYILMSRYNGLQNDSNLGIISFDSKEYKTEMNRIRKAFFELIEKFFGN